MCALSNQDGLAISLNQLERCVLGPNQVTPVLNWLERLNKQVAVKQWQPVDAFFSEEDFRFATQSPWGSDLKRFSDFNHFRAWLAQYHASQLCSEACLEPEANQDGTPPIRICPPAPEVPPLHKQQAPSKKSDPEKGKDLGLDPSLFSLANTRWWSEEYLPPPPLASTNPEVIALPSAKDFLTPVTSLEPSPKERVDVSPLTGGMIRCLRQPPRQLSTTEKVIGVAGSIFPQIWSTYRFVKNPLGWGEVIQSLKEANECYMTDSQGKRHRTGACDRGGFADNRWEGFWIRDLPR